MCSYEAQLAKLKLFVLGCVCAGLCTSRIDAQSLDVAGPVDVLTLPADLENPQIQEGDPQPGKAVFQQLPRYQGTGVRHMLYLPTDWKPSGKYPLLIEFLGNGSFVRDPHGIGYGISGGTGFVWAVVPFVSEDGKADVDRWWGDPKATVQYVQTLVPEICKQWNGDPSNVILIGYSRGAIACNYIGLHNDEIARLWKAMIAVSHYDGFPGLTAADKAGVLERFGRLRNTPQFVCGEYTVRPAQPLTKVMQTLQERGITEFAQAKKELSLVPLLEAEKTLDIFKSRPNSDNLHLLNLPWINHSYQVLLRDTPARRELRTWLHQQVYNVAPAP